MNTSHNDRRASRQAPHRIYPPKKSASGTAAPLPAARAARQRPGRSGDPLPLLSPHSFNDPATAVSLGIYFGRMGQLRGRPVPPSVRKLLDRHSGDLACRMVAEWLTRAGLVTNDASRGDVTGEGRC